MYPSMPPEPRTGFSADGYWWWNGSQWLPAFTPDRQWRFTGERWVPVGRDRRPPRWLVVSGVGWLAGLVGWLVYGTVIIAISGPDDPGEPAAIVLVSLAGLAVLTTGAWGFLVGRRRALRWLWPAAAVGTAAQLFWYAVAMLAAPSSDGSDQDLGAGAGVAILTVPIALITAALLWFGAGLGVLSRRLRR
jgi:hypothetical protein